MKLEDLKQIAAWKTLEEVQAEERKDVKEDIIKWMEDVEEKPAKKSSVNKSKKKYLSWDWKTTELWRIWEWEKDKEWRPILRKETSNATMYHISRPERVWEEWDWKNAKQYNVWCVKFKDTWKEYYWYKKDWKFNQVKFVKKPFDLANRLYVTGHAYQQKWQGEGSN